MLLLLRCDAQVSSSRTCSPLRPNNHKPGGGTNHYREPSYLSSPTLGNTVDGSARRRSSANTSTAATAAAAGTGDGKRRASMVSEFDFSRITLVDYMRLEVSEAAHDVVRVEYVAV